MNKNMKEISLIRNPVIPGFNPDPSAIRVGENYYVAVSTFEWFPGVVIYHSKDLSSWEPVSTPLNRLSQLDLQGCPASGGVWAPNLSYADGLYWLVYTNMKNYRSPAKDLNNYLVTALSIEGPWSEPVFLNSKGFDPCLFHDDNGKKWLVQLNWDYRPGKNSFGGIVLQEFDCLQNCLIGNSKMIIPQKGLQEGSNLFKKDGWYYILIADGGTGLEHSAVTVRSPSIYGPYEYDPKGILMTSRYSPVWPIQKAGHGSLFDTPSGEWYMLHLGARPIPSNGRCTLGRETFLQEIRWSQGWPRLASGDIKPAMEVSPPAGVSSYRISERSSRDNFDSEKLSIHYHTLRKPLGEDALSLTERPGWLRLKGKDSLFSKYSQSLIARRWQSFTFSASTCIDFIPETYHQSAGLVCFYDQENFYYLAVTADEELGRCLKVMISINGSYTEPAVAPILHKDLLYLKAEVAWDRLRFFWSDNGQKWQRLGADWDASTLSDEFCNEGWFTGAMVGLCCQDLTGEGLPADFGWFNYFETDPVS